MVPIRCYVHVLLSKRLTKAENKELCLHTHTQKEKKRDRQRDRDREAERGREKEERKYVSFTS